MASKGEPRRRWSIPANRPWAIGSGGSAAEIGLPDVGLADRHATVRWTGSAVEVRALDIARTSACCGKPGRRHARVPVGGQFSVGAHTFVVSGPAEISLLPEPSAPPLIRRHQLRDPPAAHTGGRRFH